MPVETFIETSPRTVMSYLMTPMREQVGQDVPRTLGERLLRQPAVARGAGEVELDDHVVEVAVAAAISVFPAQVFSP